METISADYFPFQPLFVWGKVGLEPIWCFKLCNFLKHRRFWEVLEPITTLNTNRDRLSKICVAFRELYSEEKHSYDYIQRMLFNYRKLYSENNIWQIIENNIQRINIQRITFRESHSEKYIQKNIRRITFRKTLRITFRDLYNFYIFLAQGSSSVMLECNVIACC